MLTLAAANEWVWPLLAAPFIGSFLGVLVVRLPARRPVAWGRSACEHCGATLGARDLVPLLSYAALRGRCRRCGTPIDPLHWHIELVALAVALSAVIAGARGPVLWADCAFGWTLLALTWIDARTMTLPDLLTLPLIVAGLVLTWLQDPDAATEHAMAAAVAYAALRGIALLYRALRGRDGMGAGDAKLLAAIGGWIGLEGLPSVLLLGSVAGLVAAVILRLRGAEMRASTALPFGPFLALAGWTVRLLGPWQI